MMTCCFGGTENDADPTTFVVVNAQGDMVDLLGCKNICVATRSDVSKERLAKDVERLKALMGDHSPHVCVLAADSLQCQNLKSRIAEAIFDLMEHNPRAIPEGLDDIKTVFADPSVAALWAVSKVAREEMKEQSDIVRRAVGLARYMQDPLTMVATLCHSQEILSLSLHPLQDMLSKVEHMAAVERSVVTAVNQVGIDINQAFVHQWKLATLPFVSGLGPRKARALVFKLQSRGEGGCESRELLAEDLPPNVYANCVAMLKVLPNGHLGWEEYNPLDGTRVHIESYSFPYQMACDALEITDQSEEAKRLAVERAMEEWHHVDELDLEVYAQELHRRGEGLKLHTLQDIKMELRRPFEDVRREPEELDEKRLFRLLTGETDETLKEGKILNVQVIQSNSQRVMCRLESGLKGVILKEDYSDRGRDADFRINLTRDEVITARVLKNGIDIQSSDRRDDGGYNSRGEYTIHLGCASQNFKETARCYWEKEYCVDPYYDPDPLEERAAQDRQKQQKKAPFIKRNIKHPVFKNVEVSECTRMLEDASKPVGSVIIRPSSLGPSTLSLTFKMFSGVYWHIYIKEGGKSNKNSAENLRLGSPLTIGSEEFEDLDHILAAFVEPMAGYLQSVVKHRKFKQGTRQEVDAILVKERKANPKQFPYSLSVCYEPIGFFQLTYICSSKPSHELISFDHKGFTYRMQTFPTIDRLLDDFKKRAMRNERPPPTQPPAQRAARTPGTAPRNPMGRSPGGGDARYSSLSTRGGSTVSTVRLLSHMATQMRGTTRVSAQACRRGCRRPMAPPQDLICAPLGISPPPGISGETALSRASLPRGITPEWPPLAAVRMAGDRVKRRVSGVAEAAGKREMVPAVLVLEAVVVAAAGAVKGDGARQEKVAAAVAADRGVGAMVRPQEGVAAGAEATRSDSASAFLQMRCFAML
ncbi:hypothetical protein CYMTET_48612 [Cymbomonas tetramitiformis]|uniref:SH2 domain-containing protein n=1 Tax=Cymbomonas tetramitiformis TaxID=36881 RepID=A0AAE0EVK8_9CHLO|nr:hypothetical protein CYMTET_48612 [Cymbomonas tetramitiformis]